MSYNLRIAAQFARYFQARTYAAYADVCIEARLPILVPTQKWDLASAPMHARQSMRIHARAPPRTHAPPPVYLGSCPRRRASYSALSGCRILSSCEQAHTSRASSKDVL
eukprot:355589-Chlamydomonas_euryale.AAC.10